MRCVLGQPIQYWGNLDSKRARKAYPQLRSYIFIALVARTEIDWIALDKGDIKVPTVISKLLETMEEYANYGFSVMEDKLNREPNYFFSNRSFLDSSCSSPHAERMWTMRQDLRACRSFSVCRHK